MKRIAPSPLPCPTRAARAGVAPPDQQRPPDFFSAQVSEARRFYLNLEPPARARLAVVSGGCEHCAPDYRIRRASFPFYSIEFVARGEGWLTLAGRRHRLCPGLAFAYGPGVAQDITTDPQRPLVKYFVDFAGVRAKRLLSPPAPVPGQALQTAAPEAILPLFDELIRTGLRESPLRERLCSVLVEHLLLRLADSALPPGTVGTLAFETYQRCRATIESSYLRLRSLAQIAHVCHVDPAYLCRLFRRFDHQSPYQYLTRLRMHHAAQRLQDPSALIKGVAAELGFADAFHFSRTFRRMLGVSPRRFRQLQRAGE